MAPEYDNLMSENVIFYHKVFLILISFFHFSYQSVPEQKCQTTYEHKCSTTYETSYDTVSRDKCTTEYVNMNLKNVYLHKF